ncbi:Rab proteins geranylgeranyltransferase component A [Aspergillus nanangensis]|uniref:Rab proteins geranylgeranyltransferase n=1 Tax=Aspergillus nanangensis TaxID=2582783 RepID=A0AAD4GR81_ASPNN|nr:Rab proteins geranylgeranyltransferase component A [Aspergillus nanangensis]
MESLAETPWDVTISGTGLAQSLLALALSRSGKKVLHVDQNQYYGGSEAAFSLQEAQDWATQVNEEPERFPFENAIVSSQDSNGVLASRAYTLSLSPQMIYARSELLPTLVSSKVYRQLEFLAVGSWWIYKFQNDTTAEQGGGFMYRVPSSREDVFADDFIGVKSKRTLMKFIRHIAKQEAETKPEDEVPDTSFSEYLASKFQLPAELHSTLLSLALSQDSDQQTSAAFAVPRIKRHMASIGVFGPGFGSLIAKWGGGSEISQVGCRSLAVGGGVYVLGSGIQSITPAIETEPGADARAQVRLSNDETFQSTFVIGSDWELPGQPRPQCDKVSRSIAIVSDPFSTLFPVTADGGPVPSGAVVLFPGSSLGQPDDAPPVYILVHTSETGECPSGQCVLYCSVSIPGLKGQSLIEDAVRKLLESTPNTDAKVLWSLRYTQLGRSADGARGTQPAKLTMHPNNVISFPPPSLDLTFDDRVLDLVKEAWEAVMGDEAANHEFMIFEDREGAYDEE